MISGKSGWSRGLREGRLELKFGIDPLVVDKTLQDTYSEPVEGSVGLNGFGYAASIGIRITVKGKRNLLTPVLSLSKGKTKRAAQPNNE